MGVSKRSGFCSAESCTGDKRVGETDDILLRSESKLKGGEIDTLSVLPEDSPRDSILRGENVGLSVFRVGKLSRGFEDKEESREVGEGSSADWNLSVETEVGCF